MSLIRLKASDLPMGVPLPWPIYGRNGVMLLNSGGILHHEDAEDLLSVGLYRYRDATETVERDLSERRAGSKPELPGLNNPVESVQIGYLVEGARERSLFRVDYLGRIPDTSLIVSCPQREGRLVPIGSGQNVSVNMFVSRYVHAFPAQVLSVQRLPMPHLHLSYPDTFKTSVLRSAKRVSLELRILGLLKVGEDISVPVSIVDLSNNGLALLSEYPLGDPGLEVRISFSVTQDQRTQTIRANGIIRSVRPLKSQQVYRYGVELIDLSPEQRIAIQASVYHYL